MHPLNWAFDALVASVSTGNCEVGGASRDRTDDPLLAKQVLSQLSYGPS
jgi:hypothetical protein